MMKKDKKIQIKTNIDKNNSRQKYIDQKIDLKIQIIYIYKYR